MTALPLSTGSYLVVGESNKFKLTDSIIRSFNNRGNKILRIWDTQLKGFHISITQKNHKSFYFTYRNNFNRKKWLKIGDFPKINTTQARKLVLQNYAKVATGKDPVAEMKQERYGQTVNDLIKLFIANHCSTLKTCENYVYTINKHVLPAIGHKKLNEVTRQDVLRVRSKYIKYNDDGTINGSGWSANKIKNIISKFYNWCYEEGFYIGLNPTIRIKNFPVKFRNRYLNHEEVRRFIKSCLDHRQINPLPSYALILLLITGKRKGEILNLRWSNLDLTFNTMYLPDSKVGPKSYRFSDRAKTFFLEIKNLLPKDHKGDPIVDFVFPSNSITGKVVPLKNLKRPLAAILRNAEIDNFKLHDLRHTFATHAASLTKDIRMVQQSLGHTTLKMTQRYAHFAESDQIKTCELISRSFF